MTENKSKLEKLSNTSCISLGQKSRYIQNAWILAEKEIKEMKELLRKANEERKRKMRTTKNFIECDECGLSCEEGNHDFHKIEISIRVDYEFWVDDEWDLCEDCLQNLKEKGYKFKISKR